MCEELCDDLVMRIAKSNGTIIRHLLWTGDFQNQSHMCLILLDVQSSIHKETLNVFDNIIANDVPKGLVKASREPIWLWCFVGIDGEQCFLDFTRGGRHNQCLAHLWKPMGKFRLQPPERCQKFVLRKSESSTCRSKNLH